MDIKDICNIVGFSYKEDSTIKDVQEHIKASYIGRAVAHEDTDVVKKVSGRLLGSIETKLKRSYDLTNSEIEGKKIEDIIDMGVVAGQTKITGLEKQLKETDVDKLVKAEKEKSEAWEKKHNELNGLHSTLKTEFDTLKTGSEQKLTNHYIDHAKAVVVGGIKFKEDLNKLTKKGFQQEIDDKYKLTWDADNKSLLVHDSEGKRVKDEKGIAFASYAEVVTKEANDAKILALNGVPKEKERKVYTVDKTGGGDGKTVTLHPAAVKHANNLNS